MFQVIVIASTSAKLDIIESFVHYNYFFLCNFLLVHSKDLVATRTQHNP